MAETNSDATRCRLCGSKKVRELGRIPDSDYFAGRVLSEAIPGGRLCRCEACKSMFRCPVLGDSQYLALYEASSATQWSGSNRRTDFALVRKAIIRTPRITSVLDVGCATGDFLVSLPDTIRRSGVEPSAASVIAAKQGINVEGRSMQDLPHDRVYDAITLIDVIEHVTDPALLLEKAYGHLAPGGLMFVSTGDPEATVWNKVLKSRFWYSSFPEHVSFPSFKFLALWGAAQEAEVIGKTVIRYQSLRAPEYAWSLLAQLAFCLAPGAFSQAGRLRGWLRRAPRPRRQCFSPGVPGLFVDHQVVVLRKPS